MPAYLDIAGFRDLTVMPAPDVDIIESVSPGWIERQLTVESTRLDARLAKRYAVPFAEPYPEMIKSWLARIVTQRAFIRRGVDPLDPQSEQVKADHDLALEEVKEAADSDVGLFDLPLRADTTKSGISKGGPFGYSEASPYVWTDIQREIGRDEDRNGGGTYG